MSRLLWFVLGGLATAAGIGASYLLQDECSDVLPPDQTDCTGNDSFPEQPDDSTFHEKLIE